MATKKTSPARPAKAATDKPSRARAAAAANPVTTKDVAEPPASPKAGEVAAGGQRLPLRRPQSLNFAGVGRNDICPCGSGKRFKNCHGH